jgi:Asp/Glu/hydantoin racemase
MKIWYQSFVQESLFSTYFAQLKRIIAEAKDDSSVVDVRGITKTGGLGKQHHYLEFLQTAEVLENIETANEQGYDAFIIGHFTDSGLYEAREISKIPVIGLGEASMHMACMMGRHFSLIGLNQKSLSFIEERVQLYGLSSRLSPSQTMSLKNPVFLERALIDVDAMNSVIDDFMSAATKAQSAGAEVVIPAGGVAMAALNTAGVHFTVGGATILNGIAAVVKTAEMTAKMDKLLGGRFISRALHFAPPGPDELKEIRKYYGVNAYRTLDQS